MLCIVVLLLSEMGNYVMQRCVQQSHCALIFQQLCCTVLPNNSYLRNLPHQKCEKIDHQRWSYLQVCNDNRKLRRTVIVHGSTAAVRDGQLCDVAPCATEPSSSHIPARLHCTVVRLGEEFSFSQQGRSHYRDHLQHLLLLLEI